MSILGNNLLAQYYAQNQYGLWLPAKLGYVTDGLVAMWDGEYNAGNRHAPTATSWRDCVKGMVLQWQGTGAYRWEDKCVHFLGQADSTEFFNGETGQGVNVFQEFCCAWQSINNISSASFSYKGKRISLQDQSSLGGVFLTASWDVTETTYAFKAGCGVKVLANAISTFSCWQAGTWPSGIYQNGVYRTNGNNSTVRPVVQNKTFIGFNNNTQGGESEAYCCRVYNRQLTSAEVAQNYAVDVARFGTTYQP